MPKNKVAIVGSGITGSIIAYLLTQKGYRVDIFEKGPEYPYPHSEQFDEEINYLYRNPAYQLPEDLKFLTLTGDYPMPLNNERFMLTGGSATHWEAITVRMTPNDFKTKTLYGYGNDWPVTYEELEPYYCKAEEMLGVSGTDADNPFAPGRSRPHPLPPFELSYDDVILAERLKKHGIVLHSTPQARTREDYKDREGCANFGTCFVCPIGARYSPNYHLDLARKTGLCKVHTNVSIRRIVMDKKGRARALAYQANDSSREKEHGADIVIVASGAIESARLLLLSRSNENPDGAGNRSGHVGKHLVFHHIWDGGLYYKDNFFPERFGGWTGQSHQFLDPETRGRHGGIKIEFSSKSPLVLDDELHKLKTSSEIIEVMKSMRNGRSISLHAESVSGESKYVTLSEKRDRFGDPFAQVYYESNNFDYDTHHFASKIFDRFKSATNAERGEMSVAGNYRNGAHHMGTVRMGHDVSDSVVDPYCRVHESSNMFVIGGGNFVGSAAVNPTLTILALAIRAEEYIKDQLL